MENECIKVVVVLYESTALWLFAQNELSSIISKSRFILEISFYKCSAGDKYGTDLQTISKKTEEWSQKSSVWFGDTKYLWYVFDFFIFHQVLENTSSV